MLLLITEALILDRNSKEQKPQEKKKKGSSTSSLWLLGKATITSKQLLWKPIQLQAITLQFKSISLHCLNTFIFFQAVFLMFYKDSPMQQQTIFLLIVSLDAL